MKAGEPASGVTLLMIGPFEQGLFSHSVLVMVSISWIEELPQP